MPVNLDSKRIATAIVVAIILQTIGLIGGGLAWGHAMDLRVTRAEEHIVSLREDVTKLTEEDRRHEDKLDLIATNVSRILGILEAKHNADK